VVAARHLSPAAERTSAAPNSSGSDLRDAVRAAGYLRHAGRRAVGLDRDDVDLQAGVITIRHAKFDRPRLVPPHPTVTEALSRYAAERDRLCPRPRCSAFFVSSAGTRLDTCAGPTPAPWLACSR
jgi:integrase